MRVLHIVPGTGDISNGMVVVANLLAKEQRDAEVVDLKGALAAIGRPEVEEVWVHGMWLPKEWVACYKALRSGKRLIRMTHGSLSPLYLKCQSRFKKWLVGPIERFFLRRSKSIVATCSAEATWIRSYLGHRCPPILITDIRRFFHLTPPSSQLPTHNSQLHLLYLGRRHPLKGLVCLQNALAQLADENVPFGFHVVSNVFGEEKEKAWNWCDVLVLPTLSENFGLVIAEALERGKRVITTDGAPAWGGGNTYGGRLIYLKGYRDGSPDERVRLLKKAIGELTCQF